MKKKTLQLNSLAGGTILRRVLSCLLEDLPVYSNTAASDYGLNMLCSKIQATIQYALICRQWLAFLKPRLCSTLYIKSHPPKLTNFARFKSVLKGLRSPKPHKFWTSNIKSVISMDGTRYAKALYILNNHRCPIPTLDVFLDGYGFGSVTWPKIEDIIFLGEFTFQAVVGEGRHIDLAHSYLLKFAPSVGNAYSPSNPAVHRLDNALAYQRRHLHTASDSHLTPTQFLHLTALNIDDRHGQSAHRLVSFFAPSLNELELNVRLNSSFSWRQFIDSDTDTIEFKQLTTLRLIFYIHPNTPLPSTPRHPSFYGQQQLLFPKLHTLETFNLFNALVDFRSLFDSVLLKSLSITEVSRGAPSANSMPLRYADKLSLFLLTYFNTEYDAQLMSTITYFFSSYSKTRYADIRVPLLPSTRLNWPNLINLELGVTEVDWNIVESLLGELTHLRMLMIIKGTSYDNAGFALSLRREINRYSPLSTSSMSQSLEEFSFTNSDMMADSDVSGFIQQLIIRTPSLMVIQACKSFLENISKLLTDQGVEFKHL